MIERIKEFFGFYLAVGIAEDWDYHNSITCSKKPNIIYRIYRRFNREFRRKADSYVFGGDPFQKWTKYKKVASRWTKFL